MAFLGKLTDIFTKRLNLLEMVLYTNLQNKMIKLQNKSLQAGSGPDGLLGEAENKEVIKDIIGTELYLADSFTKLPAQGFKNFNILFILALILLIRVHFITKSWS